MVNETLNRHWEELLQKANVLNVAVANKFKGGNDTGIQAIVVYVSKKQPMVELAPEHQIPPEIEGVPTDVVEFAPTTWKADKTSVSQLHPDVQRRIAGGVTPRKKSEQMTAMPPQDDLKIEVNYLSRATPVQDQKTCGFCTNFGTLATWEAILGDGTKLSELHSASCSGSTCNGGNTVENVLNQAEKGVCLESCLPYVPENITCGSDLCKDWWKTAKKIADWSSITDINQMRQKVLTKPMVTTMAVHQSFFSVVSGVYQSLGANDPVVGYHCISIHGASDALGAWLIKNSWNITWAPGTTVNGVPAPGYCWIKYGDSEIDVEMCDLVPSPDPVPNPTPAHKCWLLNLFGKKKTTSPENAGDVWREAAAIQDVDQYAYFQNWFKVASGDNVQLWLTNYGLIKIYFNPGTNLVKKVQKIF